MTHALTAISLDQLAAPDGGRMLVLTINNRHARRLVAALSAKLGADRPVMALPDILPYQAWVRQISEQLAFIPDTDLPAYRLDSFGSLLLWQDVIREAEPEHYLLDVAQAARLAREADQLMSDWLLDVPDSAATPDYQRFAAWRQAYRARLAQADAEDAQAGFEHAMAAMTQGLARPDVDWVVLAGFHEINPRLRQMLDEWACSGIQVGRLADPPTPAVQPRRVVAPSLEHEWRWAIDWAFQQLQQHPQGRYAILAPQLEAQVPLAHRLLHKRLASGPGDEPFAYNIAVARPLSEWAMVRAALAWLQVTADLQETGLCLPEVVGAALLAGHCAGHLAEAGARAQLDATWRHQAVLQRCGQDIEEAFARTCPQLSQAWGLAQAQVPGTDERRDILEWVPRIKACLAALGFPGIQALDSTAFQVLEAFERIVDDLARQRVVLQGITWPQAVQALHTLAQQTSFQPQRDASARLDVLGLLEAEGGVWDGVWVLGLTDEVLPAAPNPNPFVPLAVQKHAGTPRATPERELSWAQASYQLLLHSASQITVSCAAFEGERELRPSPFIAALPQADLIPPLTAEPEQPAPLESVVDDQGPPLAANTKTGGGVAVLEAQARNPLWAFVRFRLGAQQLPAYANVVQQTLRGIFLHACVEQLCTRFRTQQQLTDLHGSGQLPATLTALVAEVAHTHLQPYTSVMRQLECERACQVLTNWVALEQTRPPYEIVALEAASVWQHGHLQLKLRVDRVDKLATGERLVIDYKTGIGNLDPRADWVRLPPINLQLPFYAAVLDNPDEVAALVLMRLHARQVEVAGLAAGDVGFNKLAQLSDWKHLEGRDWSDLMQQWRQALTRLADDYAAGKAANVSVQATDLQYCDVLPFLRLHEEADDVVSTPQ